MKSTSIQSNPPATHRRNGNVARLPHPLRERVNRMLRDGAPYREIIRSRARQGHKLGKSNLTRWFAGGHQDWLKEQTWLQEMNGRLEFATELMRHTDAPSL